METRTALVTGSTSGIGRATALKLARDGVRVVVSGRNAQRGLEVVEQIRAEGGEAHFVAADLRDAQTAADLAAKATKVAESAGGTLDILVNNAATGSGGPTEGTIEATFDAVLGTNLKAPFYLVANLAPAMAARGGGAIVNVSTLAADVALPGLAVYGAGKAALELLTKSWAAEFGPAGVRVNCVRPGPTRTPGSEALGDFLQQLAAQAPLGFVADPADIAAAIAFLVSDEARFVTGVTLDVNGGRTAV
ncbi:short-chain dehydrogenase [Asanoa ishikariensis]|uniref:NAD(P)-dependent dehydrogenase, short-chain alcohol dehydrogenase family n=1 Tax=Asanoa ishikariensis TaxID=137265 RepID=A0A1H3KSD3_9ACTN|nr:SDR family oxidoreductase [Asanoa ishikariensis]GIF69745.1 short-chain dehydrogenase [Asanoa ishikariensis]SDY54584.1 NAD(P)-dependent dehydrogenase, short-chain alcohol dehydrogenase family [Asanoa ishikariensis]